MAEQAVQIITEGGIVRGAYLDGRYIEAEVFDFDVFDGGDRAECDEITERVRELDPKTDLGIEARSYLPAWYETLAEERAEMAARNVGVL